MSTQAASPTPGSRTHVAGSPSTVALVRCDTYDNQAVKAAVSRGMSLLGGPGAFVKKGENIVLKPNWLATALPEECCTTHPAIIKAVAELFMEAGASLSYGDSPAFQSPESVAKKSMAFQVAEELGIPLADFVTPVEVFHESGVQNKKFTVAKAVAECDGLISLPKLKTHGLMKFTGCIKNQFGVVPGALKGEFHVKLPNALDFARMLVDLNNWVAPRLYVMDGIRAMEGNGPRSGTPRAMNVILLSSDPVALDATVCRLLNLDPSLVPTTVYGQESGAGTHETASITLVGDPFESFVQKDFDIKREALPAYRPSGLFKAASNMLVPKPVIDQGICSRCGTCIRVCPVAPKAVDWHDGNKTIPPSYKYERCIRCYCCQELCPDKAITLKVPFIRRLFGGGKKAH